jgi:hypothetical protein
MLHPKCDAYKKQEEITARDRDHVRPTDCNEEYAKWPDRVLLWVRVFLGLQLSIANKMGYSGTKGQSWEKSHIGKTGWVR